MNFLNWIISLFVGEYVETKITSFRGTDVNEDHAKALVMEKQRNKSRELHETGKHWLDGYIPPEPTIRDRVDVHFGREGIVPPEKAKKKPYLVKVPKGTKKTAHG
jgi:hypothetical protein